MYRVLAVVLFCLGLMCLGQQTRAQLTMTGIGKGGPSGGSFTPSCTPSSNFLARATSVTSTFDKTAYDTMICGLNTDGVLAKLDALYIFAAIDQTTAKLNLVGTSFSPLTAIGTVSFAAYVGYTGDAATFVLDTGLVPNAGGTQFVLNSASYGVYDRSNPGLFGGEPIGSDNAVNNFMFMQRTTSGLNCAVNGGAVNMGVAMANDQGFWVCDRTSSSNVSGSMNGGAGVTAASTSTALDNVSTTIFAKHDGVGSVYAAFTSDQLSAAFIGGALTDPNLASLSSRINNYMMAYGINVY